ncbi:helix-turn-helix domain-containing protein [Staphylococcus saprophyticus]|uniref:helix-turn-helix domain-containing protein n=1 Tax=Staphylococcus saprophyticus TaxID=29385 RepID=UPI0009904EE3|nr:helix-turn-helix transcriptional regulator [Staphylococcus saprophyticus]OOO72415.1 transcriptional regulator [Staphylococcus saprophyticus]
MNGYNKLKGLLTERNIKNKDLAELLNIHRITVNKKLNRTDGNDFSMTEVRKICLYLDISADIYFLNESRENTTKQYQTTY